MDRMRQELFPRTRFAGDQDQQVTERAEALHCVEDRQHSRAFSDTPHLLHDVFDSVLFVLPALFYLQELPQEATQLLGKLCLGAVEQP
jgi:hypothetical protein